MHFMQQQIKPLHHPPHQIGKTDIRTLTIEKLVPINDAQHRETHWKNAGKRICAILVMLAMSAFLVWAMG